MTTDENKTSEPAQDRGYAPADGSEVFAEIARAMKKFPQWPTDPIHAATVIAEEVGELQKSVLEAVYEPHKGSKANIRIEAIQAAAMCHRFLMSLDKYEFHHSKQHSQNKERTFGRPDHE